MMQKNWLVRSLATSLCSLGLVMGGCVAHYPSSDDDFELPKDTTTPADNSAAAASPMIGPMPASAAEQDAQKADWQATKVASLVTKLAQIDSQLSQEEYSFLKSLPADSGRGSLEEAAKALGALHLAIQGEAIGSAFGVLGNEDDHPVAGLHTNEASADADAGTAGAALEGWANHLQVRLPPALAYNQALKSYGVQVLVLRALKKGGQQSQEFVAEVTAAVQQNAKVWGELQQQLSAQSAEGATEEGNASAEPDASAGAGEASAPAAGPLAAVAPALPFGSSEFSSDEDVLKQGQGLIEDGKYEEAIKILQGLAESNIFHAAAQEKIKEASNLAVQDLRRKAAKAFQSAIPVNDRRTRAAYLEDARRYLQAAIDQYPQAEQISTVKQNLSVINQNLETLGGPTTSTH